MKARDISIGAQLYTIVSGEKVFVEVVSDTGARGRRYIVKRVDNGKYLPKSRSAAALHPTATGYWPGMTEKQETIAHVQNGRPVTWPEVTTEDLRATIVNYPNTDSAKHAREEWRARMGRDFA